MFRNYVVTALRNMAHNKIYAVLNLAGLSVGFTAALLIALFVRHELTYDRFWPGYEDVYRVGKSVFPPRGPAISIDSLSAVEADWLAGDIPEIAAIARFWPDEYGLRHGEIEATETIAWTDASVMKVLPLRAVEGDVKAAIEDPSSLVLTRRTARKYFGRERVVGETLEIDRKFIMRVGAVIEDLPTASHLRLSVLGSLRASASPYDFRETRAGLGSVLTYARIAPANLQAVAWQTPGVWDRHCPDCAIPGIGRKPSELYRYDLQPLADVHLLPPATQFSRLHSIVTPAGDLAMVKALGGLGILILLVAMANFVNLTTARASRRGVEVGVRKTTGAQRPSLVAQFMGEALLYTVAAMLLATGLAFLLLPAFGTVLDREISFGESGALAVVAAVPLVSILIAALSGVYPTLVLSSFRPATVLKRGGATKGNDLLRRILVVGQFATMIGVIIGAVAIERQTSFAIHGGFRLDTDQVLLIATPCRDSFKDQVAALPGVKGAACGAGFVVGSGGAISLVDLPDGTRANLNLVLTDPGLLEVYGLRPLAGRFFSAADPPPANEDFGKKEKYAVINATAARQFGFASPEAAIGQARGETEIIGVAPDFPIGSIRERIEPTMYLMGGKRTHLAVKIDGAHIGETLQAIDAAWLRLGTGRPIARQFHSQRVEEQYASLQRQGEVFALFAGVAILLAGLGLLGLSAFTAERRTKEIGVRKAMGASRLNVLRMLTWEFLRPVIWANLVAWPAAGFVLQRWLEGFAYHIDLQVWMFALGGFIAIVIAAATVTSHAILIARAQPIHALRYE